MSLAVLEASEHPFRHWICEAEPMLQGRMLNAGRLTPAESWTGWVRYDNDLEAHKRTARAELPQACATVLEMLTGPFMSERLRQITGIENLMADKTMHGAGIHVTDPGGYLQPHLDYSLHECGLERRINLIAFLTRGWLERWGGAFQLCDPLGNPLKVVFPKAGRIVLWESSDLAYHGTAMVADDAPPRITAAVYYLASPRPGCTRRRALFIPKRP
jgi:Rps23 Pro-64 3,4-dihydroxylase Tpa1-like proline 4-hydroxylase